MSASRTAVRATRSGTYEVSSDEYDSEEERYQRKRQRLLKKVAESAAAIKAINDLTRPFFTGSWRLEREEELERQQKLLDEQRAKENSLVNSLTPSKENHKSTLKKTSDSWNENNDDDTIGKMSSWTPLKHSTNNGVHSVLEMEKTPTWNPLRKSKARHSLALFSTDSKCKTSVDQDDDPSIACQPLTDGSDLQSPVRTLEETRTPLRPVVSSNQAVESRKSVLIVSEPAPTASSSEDISTPDRCNIDLHFMNNHDGLLGASSTVGDCKLETPVKRLVKTFKSPVRISPILLQAFGEERARVRGSIGSPDKVVNLDECTSPKDPSKVLKNVVAYVEVRRGEDDRTAGFQWKLKELGATVLETLNRKVTHVVFQEGLLSTFRKAKQLGAHIVSTHWVMACDESFTKVQESRYPIEKLSRYELADPLQKTIKRPKIMSPDLGSGRDDKAFMKRRQRLSIKVNSPLTQSPAFTIPVIKTPSPVKSRWKIRKSMFVSPSSKDATGEDSVDDYDGFLAMVEAQVREKAEHKRESGEMNGPPLDFETRLQLLLGCGKEDSQDKQQNPPLASIFLKSKSPVATSAQGKKSPKKSKTSKPSLPPASSSSVMRNWLQSCSPKAGQHGGISTVSAAAAASAAADKILDSMLKGSINDMFSKVIKKPHTEKTDTSYHNATPVTQTVTSTQAIAKVDKKSVKDIPLKPFMFTSTLENNKTKTSQFITKKTKKSDCKGKEACPGAMRSWLMTVKSPSKSAKPALMTSSVKTSSPIGGDNKRKRKANSLKDGTCLSDLETIDDAKPSKKVCKQTTPRKNVETSFVDHKLSSLSNSPNGVNFSKNHAGERTPQSEMSDDSCPSPRMSSSYTPLAYVNLLQQSPSRKNCSASKSKGKKTEDIPRRRSLRLTPVKMTSPHKNIRELETLEEHKETFIC